MKEDLSLFHTFKEKEEAREFIDLLKVNEVAHKVIDSSTDFDVSFANNEITNEIRILIAVKDFEKAKELRREQYKEVIHQLPNDYYLYAFTDDELYDVLLKPEEWNVLDEILAETILKERGKAIDKSLLKKVKEVLNEENAKPDSSEKGWIVGGYFFAFMGGFLGLLIGWYLWNQQKTLSNGEKVWKFNESDRKHGQTIFILSIVFFVIYVALRVFFIDKF